jgi:hypothetical protein
VRWRAGRLRPNPMRDLERRLSRLEQTSVTEQRLACMQEEAARQLKERLMKLGEYGKTLLETDPAAAFAEARAGSPALKISMLAIVGRNDVAGALIEGFASGQMDLDAVNAAADAALEAVANPS